MKRVYLDWASTAPISGEALEKYRKTALSFPGNPSSVHAEGKAASAELESCRKRAAALLGVSDTQIYFTSGGTESDAVVLHSFLSRMKSGSVVIPRFEHPAVWEYAARFAAAGIGVVSPEAGSGGVLEPEALSRVLGVDCALVCCMAVHNETGAIHPVAELTDAVRRHERLHGRKIHVHCDAVQAAGKSGIDPAAFAAAGIDSIALSGHKVRGPRGVGLLYLKNPLETPFPGGGQERGIRPGTENLPAIAAFTAALERASAGRDSGDEAGRALFQGLSALGSVQILPRARRAEDPRFVTSIVSASVPSLPSEVIVRVMNDRGFAISAGSACSARSGKKRRRALEASGVSPKEAAGAFRVSIGPETTVEEVRAFLEALSEAVDTLII